jgi:glucose-6-phosphate isomerase
MILHDMKTPDGIAGNEVRSEPLISLDWAVGTMHGAPVAESFKTVGDLAQIFGDKAAQRHLESGSEVYRVRWWSPVEAGSEGGLFWGVTTIAPGKVGDEYFMTHGHFHANRTRAEYYGTVSGDGMLIQMDGSRKTWGETMAPGSLHYIRGENAHRVANTGSVPLVFWACWPSDAGYDYGTIAEHGFGARLVERDGRPAFVPAG